MAEPESTEEEQMRVISPSGESGSVPKSQYEAALSHGYRPEGEGVGVGRALALGLASGVTGGLSKGMVPGGPEVGSEEALAQANAEAAQAKREHPGLSLVGEIGGSLVNPISRIASPGVGAGVIGRIAGTAATGVVQGGLFGLTETLGENALGDSELNAEKLASGIGMGALWGGAGGTLGGSLVEAAPKIGEVAGDLGKKIGKWADAHGIKALGGTAGDIGRLGDERVGQIVKELSDRGLFNGGPEERASKIGEALVDAGKNVGRELKIPELESGEFHANLENEEANKALDALKDKHWERERAALAAADKSGANFSYSKQLVRNESWFNGLNEYDKSLVRPEYERVQSAIQKMGELPAGEGTGFEALTKLRSSIDRAIPKNTWATEGGSQLGDLKKQLVGQLRSGIDEQLGQHVSPGVLAEYADAKRVYGLLKTGEAAIARSGDGDKAILAMLDRAGEDSGAGKLYGLMSDASKLAGRGLAKSQTQAAIGMLDAIRSGVAGIASGHPATAIPALAAQYVWKKYGLSYAVGLAKRLAENPATRLAAQSFVEAAARNGGLAISRLGRYAPIIKSAMSSSPEQALATHTALAMTDPQYVEASTIAGLGSPSMPGDTQMAIGRAAALAHVASIISEHDKEIDEHIDRALSEGGTRKLRPWDSSVSTAVDTAHGLTSNPTALADKLSEHISGIGEVAPSIASAHGAVQQRALQYIAQKSAIGGPAGPMARPPEYSRQQKYEIARAVEVADEPNSILEHFASGTLTPSHVQALKAIYPRLHQDFSQRLLDKVAERPNLPYRKRLMLHMMTGTDADGSLSQRAIASAQAAHMLGSGKSGENTLQNNSPSRSRAKSGGITLGKRTATLSQRADEELA